jgi:hypothetical protein
MKSKKTNAPRETSKDRMTVPDSPTLGDLSPILREQFGSIVIAKKTAERRNTLAILKILELIVSGRVHQQAGEDYFVTTCRLIVYGPSDVRTSAATRRELNKALAEIKGGDLRTIGAAGIVEMRNWRGRRAVTRTILLLTMLERSIGPRELTGWLERSNPNLGNRAPADLLRANRWVMLADFIDNMLTGSPT